MTVKKPKKRQKSAQPTDKLLPKITIALFGRPKTVFVIWLTILVFGIASYATLLRREGFPSVNIPIAVVVGTYPVNDPAKVDADIGKPLSEIALKQEGVSRVSSQSAANFVNVTVQYAEGTNGEAATKQFEQQVKQQGILPSNVELSYSVPYFGATGGSTAKIDATLSFYRDPTDSNTAALAQKAEEAVAYLNQNKPSQVVEFFVEKPFDTATNPATGESQIVQNTFDQFGVREDDQTKFFNSVIIGVTAIDDVDVIELDAELEKVTEQLHDQEAFKEYKADISASFAPAIEESISELQRVLLEGLLAVLVVGSIVIAVRASLITVLSMVTVISATLGLLFLLGYTLNVITLFALILGLALIVDDTIIMVEAIDAARRRNKTPKEAVRQATQKISRAMVAATTTAALSFLPLAFVSGVLGTFIRAIPITIISALFISLVVALVFIPLFSRYLLLGKKQMGEKGVTEVASVVESRIAHFLTRPMQWARGSIKRRWIVGLTSIVVGLLFVGGAGVIFNKVTFNLFPPSKDTNALSVQLAMPQGSTIDSAQAVALKADAIVAEELGKEFDIASYYGTATPEIARMQIELTPYTQRGPSSVELTNKVQQALNTKLTEARAIVSQVDVGPPASAFTVQIKSEDRAAAFVLAKDVAAYLTNAQLSRTSGSTAGFVDVNVSTESSVVRSDAKQVVQVTAGFKEDDTTTLVTLAQDALKKEFPEDRVASYGLAGDALGFDLGQEAENQESFQGLLIAFPLVLLVIFVLLAIEFRSLLQPLLIFLAIPFSLFGVTLGLFVTDNAFSFFCAMGFFALIGLSIKNTILLVDYANQSRRAGMGAIDAAAAALEERFRPLIATSLTAVVSLIPLAIISPFWQGLAVVLIGGLLSSTFLVITVFPYYYLGGEYLRARISTKGALTWLGLSILTGVVLAQIAPMAVSLLAALAVTVLWPIFRMYSIRRSNT